jgi:hypothetical protein
MVALATAKRRNDSFADLWSLAHVGWAAVLGWIMNPFAALVLMVLWEPLEIFVLSPLLARFGITFGYESLRNSLSDIFFDVLGVILGAYILSSFFDPPFYIFG